MIQKNVLLADSYERLVKERSKGKFAQKVPRRIVNAIKEFPYELENIITDEYNFDKFKEEYKDNSKGIGRIVYSDLKKIINYEEGVEEILKCSGGDNPGDS